MADNFHFSVNIISRGKGKSAVASAAYISGEKIKNEWDGEIQDYTRKEKVKTSKKDMTKEIKGSNEKLHP